MPGGSSRAGELLPEAGDGMDTASAVPECAWDDARARRLNTKEAIPKTAIKTTIVKRTWNFLDTIPELISRDLQAS